MENNNKDFMNNRPVVAGVNRIQEVYGSSSKGAVNAVTVILAIITAVCTVLFYVNDKSVFAYIFLFVFILLIVSTVISYCSSRKTGSSVTKNPGDNGAIFKDHDI